ncbi:hypothetical protein [Burkholderia perseverans]|uniref:hypothetical protein n=1 Tax=Burkholderia perseverans TaxID=2615214 RepID=UPI001FF03170|nr:hypothetical protein [Burkholderia perseverans]
MNSRHMDSPTLARRLTQSIKSFPGKAFSGISNGNHRMPVQPDFLKIDKQKEMDDSTMKNVTNHDER